MKSAALAFQEGLLSCVCGASVCLGLQITRSGARNGAPPNSFAVNTMLWVSLWQGELVKGVIRYFWKISLDSLKMLRFVAMFSSGTAP